MRTRWIALVVFVMLFALGASATVRVDGTVTTLGANSVTVSTRTSVMVVKADSNTVVRRHGKEFNFASIAVGDRIRATGTRIDDAMILASKIDVHSSH